MEVTKAFQGSGYEIKQIRLQRKNHQMKILRTTYLYNMNKGTKNNETRRRKSVRISSETKRKNQERSFIVYNELASTPKLQ